MGLIYSINYLIFSVFLILFSIEVGISVNMLMDYNRYAESIKRFLMPLWEVTGTFAVFYLVNFEASFPSMLYIVGTIFILPLLLAGILFIFRNSFLAYSEYIGRGNRERNFIRVYATATILIAFIVLSVFDAGVSGVGVNIAAYNLNMPSMLFNTFNIMMFVGLALISVFVSAALFGIRDHKLPMALTAPVGVLIILEAVYYRVPYMIGNMISNYVIITAIVLAILVAAVVSFVKETRVSRYLTIIWLFLSINLFGLLQSPYMFGGEIDTYSYIATGPTAYYVNVVTIIGGVILALSISYLVYMSYVKRVSYKEGNGNGVY